MNNHTVNIFYDQRVVISEPREEPIVWQATKIEDLNVKGIVRVTFAQKRWNEHTDFIEKDPEGNVIGMWADYYADGLVPTDSDDTYQLAIYGTITYSGASPLIKVGGSYKKFTVTFFDLNGETRHRDGTWSCLMDGQDVSDLVTMLTPDDSKDIKENQVKIRFDGDDTYIGKSMTIQYVSDDGITAKVDVGVVGL